MKIIKRDEFKDLLNRGVWYMFCEQTMDRTYPCPNSGWYLTNSDFGAYYIDDFDTIVDQDLEKRKWDWDLGEYTYYDEFIILEEKDFDFLEDCINLCRDPSLECPVVNEGIALLQLAEECSELSKAALKLNRKLGGFNPTPLTLEVAKSNLMEEIADVRVCLRNLENIYGKLDTRDIERLKIARWKARLEERLDEDPV